MNVLNVTENSTQSDDKFDKALFARVYREAKPEMQTEQLDRLFDWLTLALKPETTCGRWCVRGSGRERRRRARQRDCRAPHGI